MSDLVAFVVSFKVLYPLFSELERKKQILDCFTH